MDRTDPIKSIAKSVEILSAGDSFKAYVKFSDNDTPILLEGIVVSRKLETISEDKMKLTYVVYSKGKKYTIEKEITYKEEPFTFEESIGVVTGTS